MTPTNGMSIASPFVGVGSRAEPNQYLWRDGPPSVNCQRKWL